MMNFKMGNGSFIDKCHALRQMKLEVEQTRNTIVFDIIQNMEIGRAYTVEELNRLTDSRLPIEMLSGAMRSLISCPAFEEFTPFGMDMTEVSSLRQTVGSGRIVNGERAFKRTFFIECDEYGNIIPDGKRTFHTSPRNTYVRVK